MEREGLDEFLRIFRQRHSRTHRRFQRLRGQSGACGKHGQSLWMHPSV